MLARAISSVWVKLNVLVVLLLTARWSIVYLGAVMFQKYLFVLNHFIKLTKFILNVSQTINRHLFNLYITKDCNLTFNLLSIKQTDSFVCTTKDGRPGKKNYF